MTFIRYSQCRMVGKPMSRGPKVSKRGVFYYSMSSVYLSINVGELVFRMLVIIYFVYYANKNVDNNLHQIRSKLKVWESK
jgi:hypothetical protein